MSRQTLPRSEDRELLTGRARFLDDLDVARFALLLGVVRSPFPHAEVHRRSPVAFSGTELIQFADVAHLQWAQLLPAVPPLTPLAGDRARYVGHPVAAVLAEDRTVLFDALNDVNVTFEPLPASVTVAEALAPDAPLVYEEMTGNIVWNDESESDPRRFDAVDYELRRTFVNPRVAPAMMECRGVVAVPEEGGGVTVYVSHQNPHKLRNEIATIFDLDPALVRVVVPQVGGAFGAKSPLYPEYVLSVHAALRSGRPVKYVETRSENLAVTTQGRGQVQRIRLGASRDGRLQALRVEIDADFGAAVDIQRWCVMLSRYMLSGAYRIPHIEWSIRGVLTHTAPVGAFRGAGRPEAAYLIERAMDELARDLAIDPAEIRRTNFIRPDEFPYETGTGVTYDSGAYQTALDAALDRIGYSDVRRRDPEQGRVHGVGIACYVQMAAGGEEYADVAIDADGRVLVHTGTLPHGQGHETTWAQITAAVLGVAFDRVKVNYGDTAAVPRGGGTSGSRSTPLGGSAVHLAAGEVAKRLRDLAARRLEAPEENIRLEDGRAVVAGTDTGVDLATLVADHGAPIMASHVFAGSSQNFPFGTHVCLIEMDPDTGEVEVADYVEVDDCGEVIDPRIVEGQLLGGTLQGISYALAEAGLFDWGGEMSGGDQGAFHIPTIGAAPMVRCARTETPSPINPLGVKGVGESGITGAVPAVANAVHDALAKLGVHDPEVQVPFTPGRVWAVIQRTR